MAAWIWYGPGSPWQTGGWDTAPTPPSQLRVAAQLSRNPNGAKVFVDHGPTPGLGATVEAEVRNLVTQIPDSGGGVWRPSSSTPTFPWPASGRMPHFYRGAQSAFVTDPRSAATTIPTRVDALGPRGFTMMGAEGTDENPMLPPGIARGDYDDSYYKPDNDPAAPHTENVLNQLIASRPDFHVLAGDIAYADPSGLGKPATFVPSGGEPQPAS